MRNTWRIPGLHVNILLSEKSTLQLAVKAAEVRSSHSESRVLSGDKTRLLSRTSSSSQYAGGVAGVDLRLVGGEKIREVVERNVYPFGGTGRRDLWDSCFAKKLTSRVVDHVS